MVVIYGFSAKQAEAEGVATVFTQVLIVVAVVALAIVTSGTSLGLQSFSAAWIVGSVAAGITAVTQVVCLAGSSNVGFSGCGDDNGSQWQGTAGSPTLQNQSATPIVSSDGTCTTGFTLNYTVTDAYKYAIYRDDKQIYHSGFLGDEKEVCGGTGPGGIGRVSDCDGGYNEDGDFSPPTAPGCFAKENPVYDEDGRPIYEYKYDRDGNVIEQKQKVNKQICKKEYYTWPSPHNYSFSYTDSGLAPNKDYKYELILMDSKGKQFRYPELNAYSECIKLDLKVNGRDEPSIVKVASNYVTVNWFTEGALSCLASGDWSGSKGPATGLEELGKIARGTSNPGKGKTYNYSMTCQYPKNKTLTDSGSVTVFKYPECNFSADPAVIEILPATSTLSWDCRYYGGTPDEGSDTCSIDHGIGSVSPLNDSIDVRPSQETTYTLTCSTIDKTSDYQTSVKVGFRPRVREVNPGAW